jgi:hypothetical protein
LLIGAVVVAAAADEMSTTEFIRFDRLLGTLIRGRYGLDALFTARSETLQVAATFSTGETKLVWRGLPDAGQWAAASLLWIGIGAACLAAAVSRHRETRRA